MLSSLCSEARDTVVPASSTGSSSATGVSVPTRPTCTVMSLSRVVACRGGYLYATAQRGALRDLEIETLPVADVERTEVRYGDFSGLARDLRAHGLTNALRERRRTFLRRDTLAALLAHYRAHHAEEGKLKATFEIIYLTGWAPHESQQQPLKPGSAKSRLAEALHTVEHKLGKDQV